MLPLRPLGRARDRGFSFIELLAYMAIAALLILAAVPQFSAYRERALVSNLQSDVRNASLNAEASLIAKRSGPAVKLASTVVTVADSAPTPGSIEAIATAVAATKLSDSQSTLKTVDLTGGEYEIRGTNPKTDRMVVFASKADVARGFEQGLSLVDASRNDDGATTPGTTVPGTTTPGTTTPGPTTPAVSTTVCSGVAIPNKAPTATITEANLSKNFYLEMHRDYLAIGGQAPATAPLPFAGDRVGSAGVRIWIGDQAVCPPVETVAMLNAPASSGPLGATGGGIDVTAWSGGEDWFTSEQVMTREPITIQVDGKGGSQVLRFDHSANWYQADDYMIM